MKTIITESTANSMFIHGIFYNGKSFVNKYGDILENTWVVNCFWTNQNSNLKKQPAVKGFIWIVEKDNWKIFDKKGGFFTA